LSAASSDENLNSFGEKVPAEPAPAAVSSAEARPAGAAHEIEELEPEEIDLEPSAEPPALPEAVAGAAEEDRPTEPHLPPPDAVPQKRLAAAPPPPSSRMPPRSERNFASVARVVLSGSGEVLDSRGAGPDDFAARVAYAARLAELIGRAIRSGAPRALELRGKGTHTNVNWQGDGNVSASLELVQSPKIR
jgi:hypothetical protein